jgi:alkylhydroperoxidase family enzyme
VAYIPYRRRGEDPAWDAALDDFGEAMDHILAVHGPNPESLRRHVALYRWVMAGPSPLSRLQREMLAVVTSAANSCHY